MAKGAANALGPDFCSYTWDEWLEVEPADDEAIRTARGSVAVPVVIYLTSYDRVPKREIRFSRRNIFLRDEMCMYCGHKGPASDFNLDHVKPIAQGGRSEWLNVVCSCRPCNSRKADRTPEQAGMKLLKQPNKPTWAAFLPKLLKGGIHPAWTTFLVGRQARQAAR